MNTPATNGAAPELQVKDPELKYICGDCGVVNYLTSNMIIRCASCGYRILYKARTQRRKYDRMHFSKAVILT